MCQATICSFDSPETPIKNATLEHILDEDWRLICTEGNNACGSVELKGTRLRAPERVVQCRKRARKSVPESCVSVRSSG
jgi:hypothetical protein